jgi:hypothetical protein
MSNEPVTPDPELTAIEGVLGSLVPARSRIDRDLVMFRAGQASVRSSRLGRWGWHTIAASLAMIALGEGVLLARRPPPRIVVVVREPETVPAPVVPVPEQSVAEAPGTVPTEYPRSLGQTDYERLTAQVLRYGLDGLPAYRPVASSASVSGPRPASAGQMLQSELSKLTDLGDPS